MSKESLERQLALTESIRSALEKKLAEALKKENEHRISLESANSQISELKSQLGTRISAEEAERKRRIDVEEEKAVLFVQLEAARGAVTASAGSMDGSDLDTYRVLLRSERRLTCQRIARCGICNDRWKDTTIVLCGHVFCKTCVDVCLFCKMD